MSKFIIEYRWVPDDYWWLDEDEESLELSFRIQETLEKEESFAKKQKKDESVSRSI